MFGINRIFAKLALSDRSWRRLGATQTPISLNAGTLRRKCPCMMKVLVVGLITSALAAITAYGQQPFLAELKGVKDLKISLGANAAEPSVRMLCREIGMESARIGFLRVSLLRFPVVRGMELRLRDGSTTWASDFWAYAKAEEWLSNASVRGFRIVGSDDRPLLRASTAKLNMPLATLDLDEINLNLGGQVIDEKFARLWLQGSKEGILELPGKEIRIGLLIFPIR